MNGSVWISVGAAFGGLGVVIGAFGAHALKNRLDEYAMSVFKTGVEYHFYHALALIVVGVLMLIKPSAMLGWSALAFTVGIIIFSGSLYALALSGIKVLGAITPIGGVALIAGWVLLAASAHKL